MSELNIPQALADSLLAIEKGRIDDSEWKLDGLHTKLIIPLVSLDRKEDFILDIYKSEISLKSTYQNRGRKIIVLARIDLGGSPHRNPDDSEVPCPHIHLYKEDFGTKWAYPIPGGKFQNTSNLWQTLNDFIKYCNIVNPPKIVQGLYT